MARNLPGHDVTTVQDEGWASVKNGRLLALIEKAAFVTCDKQMEFQQSLSRRPFAVLLLSTNHWPSTEPHVGMIAKTLELAEGGTEVYAAPFTKTGALVAVLFRLRPGTRQ